VLGACREQTPFKESSCLTVTRSWPVRGIFSWLVASWLTGGRCAGARNGFVSVPTAVAWSPRYREAGEAGLEARTSRPASCPHRTGVRTQRRVLGCR
jgi:hypothetical protein